jgi:pimeloyl-ACP methyl ester carboxylesterase
MLREQIQGPAGALYVDDGGSGGLPVLFVHSFAGSTAHWLRQLAHLRLHRRAVALDLRGHGQSDAPADGDFRISSLADDVFSVADALGMERFVLVGHSLGGTVAIACASASPQRVAGLLLAGTPGKSPPDQSAKVLAAMQSDYDRVTADYWKQLLENAQPAVSAQVGRDMRRVPKEASLSIIRAVFEFDPLPALRSYAGPVWIVTTPHGDTPAALHRQLPGIPYVMVLRTSHWMQLDKPGEFNQVLDDFLAAAR